MTSPAPLRACLLEDVRGMTWREVERIGRAMSPDGFRGWHIRIWVRYAGAPRKRVERITWAPGLGRIETEAEAIRVLDRIRAQGTE